MALQVLFPKFTLRTCLLNTNCDENYPVLIFFLWFMSARDKNNHNVYAKFRFDICTKSLSAMPRGVRKSAKLELVLTETQG